MILKKKVHCLFFFPFSPVASLFILVMAIREKDILRNAVVKLKTSMTRPQPWPLLRDAIPFHLSSDNSILLLGRVPTEAQQAQALFVRQADVCGIRVGDIVVSG